jgi:peptidoglycan hydrolase-like protein with peptidoglycan-binding domain
MKKGSIITAAAFGVFLAAGIAVSAVSAPLVFAQNLSMATSTFLDMLITSPSVATATIVLKSGERSLAVGSLQTLLMNQGYLSVAAPTNYFGSLTKAAVMALEKDQNVPQVGFVAIPMSKLAAFYAAAAPTFAPLSFGNTGAGIGLVQQSLIRRGYLNISTSTSYFGSMTQAAVIAFQKAHNLPQTGIVDRATFFAMNGK